jgi:hypothetical protein
MDIFRGIFDRHFFSNHHVEAIELENKFEKYFPGFECVTYSGLAGLIVAVFDELVDPSTYLYATHQYPVSLDFDYKNINRFLCATGRPIVKELPIVGQSMVIDKLRQYGIVANSYSAILMSGLEVEGVLFDLKKYHPLLSSGGLFVSTNSKMAEKIRWSRSSYGRRQDESINIGANGRFSEFQAALVNSSFDGL